MLKVKDVMTKNVICVQKDTPVVEAIRLIAEREPYVTLKVELHGVCSNSLLD
jgi:CBS domain-containing protein